MPNQPKPPLKIYGMMRCIDNTVPRASQFGAFHVRVHAYYWYCVQEQTDVETTLVLKGMAYIQLHSGKTRIFRKYMHTLYFVSKIFYKLPILGGKPMEMHFLGIFSLFFFFFFFFFWNGPIFLPSLLFRDKQKSHWLTIQGLKRPCSLWRNALDRTLWSPK